MPQHTLLKWFKSYLTNRKQYVSCNNSTSLPRDITYGVFFILYTNDLPLCLNKSKSMICLDDPIVCMNGQLINDLCKDINTELADSVKWFHANKLSLNV